VAFFAVVGSVVGVRINKRISATQLQRGFGWFVIAVGVAVLVREVC